MPGLASSGEGHIGIVTPSVNSAHVYNHEYKYSYRFIIMQGT